MMYMRWKKMGREKQRSLNFLFEFQEMEYSQSRSNLIGRRLASNCDQNNEKNNHAE